MSKKSPARPRRPATARALSIGTVLFTEPELHHLANDLKFTRRAPRKITIVNLFASVGAECLQGSPRCNDLAAQVQTLAGTAPSRQAVSLRLNPAFESILQRLHRLLAVFIDPYSKNDQAAAPELLLQKGGRSLRDRGCLVGDEIHSHQAAEADCIYRHKTGTVCLAPRTGQPIDLLALLQNQGLPDLEVLLNHAARTRVRLVTAPVDAPTANLRRRKAKKATKGHCPSQAVLALMDWTIFMAPIPAAKASFKEILARHGLQSRIEVIFKAWKSPLKFPLLHRVSTLQRAILLNARLLVITACTNLLQGPRERILSQNDARRLSLLKLTRLLSNHPPHLLCALRSLTLTDQQNRAGYETLVRYCCYDKRKRQNYSQTWDALA